MFNIPNTEKKLRNKISTYNSALKKEKKIHGFVRDGSGKRYLLFSLYFVLDNLEKSQEYFDWYQKEFPNDMGDPIQKLCWAVSLRRMGKDEEAKYKLADLMLSNLYFIPHLIGQKISEYDIWHSSNVEEIYYIEYIPVDVKDNIRPDEIQWMKELYLSDEFSRIRKRYVEIYHELLNTHQIETRKNLLRESYSLLESL